MKIIYAFDYLEKLAIPVGNAFTWPFSNTSREVEKTGENTFEIHDIEKGFRSAIVDGDTLVKLFLGKETLLNLKFE